MLSVPDLIDQLELELDAAGLDRPDIVGNSLGGWCALELAKRGRARRVVAIGPAGMQDQQQGIRFMRLFTQFRVVARRTPRLASFSMASPLVGRQALAMVARRADRLPAPLVRDIIRSVAECELPDLFAPALGSGAQLPSIEKAEDIDVPVLILWGTRDPLVTRDQVDRYLAAIPNSRLVELDGLSHCPQLDDPDRVAAEILGFVREAS